MKNPIQTVTASIALVFIAFFASFAENSKLEVYFFGSKTCGECLEIKQKLLKPLEEEFKDKLKIHYHDFENTSSFELMLEMEEIYDVSEGEAQELFLPDTFLLGYSDIMAKGHEMIIERLENPQIWKTVQQKTAVSKDSSSFEKDLKGKAMDWSFLFGTIGAGLADGVNPCAIATMIFLISFLSTRKKKRSEILSIGLAYTFTVFITYFAMGLGLKGILEKMQGYHYVSLIIRWGAFSLAAGVAFFSFRDAFVFRKTKDTHDIKLQLPTSVKLRIHKVISGNLSGTSLVIGAVITGFLVTLLEAICTGQMYVPYMVAMTQKASLKLHGYFYLALYNFLFVLPLLIVMILAYFGLKWTDLAKKTQKNMVTIKIVLGLVMTGLAAYIGKDLLLK